MSDDLQSVLAEFSAIAKELREQKLREPAMPAWVPFAFAVFMQILGSVWWISQTHSDVLSVKKELAELSTKGSPPVRERLVDVEGRLRELERKRP